MEIVLGVIFFIGILLILWGAFEDYIVAMEPSIEYDPREDYGSVPLEPQVRQDDK